MPQAPESGSPSASWITAFCDGGSRGNPGPSGYGVRIEDANGNKIEDLYEFLGVKTNNFAEYSALLAALEFALATGHTHVRVVADSELMVKQMQGKYRVKSPDLRPLYDEAKRRIAKLQAFRIEHVLRGKNKHADRLANLAMDKGAHRTIRDLSLAPRSSTAPLPARSAPASVGPPKNSSAIGSLFDTPSAASLQIRPATTQDLPRLTEIYNHYVALTPVTFDVEPWTIERRAAWLAQFAPTGRYRLYVAVESGVVQGYAGSTRFRPKAAYDTTVETTIYCAPDAVGKSLGSRLYEALFQALAEEDIHRIVAGYTLPNDASAALHARFGFRNVGIFREVGRKFDRYWDVGWLERPLLL